MLEDLILELVMPLGVDPNNDFSKFKDAFKLERQFGLSGTLESGLRISQFLRLSTVPADPGARFHAVIKSEMRFQPAVDNSPPYLELRPFPFPVAQLGVHLRNSPPLFGIMYGNVEPNSASEAALAILVARGVPEEDRQKQLAEYMAGERWLQVNAGDVIGRGAIDANLNGRRRLDLGMYDKHGIYLNPAHFLFQWDKVNHALEGHPLTEMLRPLQHPFVFPTKGRVLFVKQTSPTPAPPYDDFNKAARKINDALDQAQSGDVVLVVDNAFYNEKLFVPNGVSLTSVGAIGKIGRIQQEPPEYPIVSDSSLVSSAIVIDGSGEAPTHVSGFRITGGVGPGATTILNGGGIRIENCQNVEVAHNEIYDNVAVRGGGIAVIGSRRVSIAGNRIRHNVAKDGLSEWGQGGGVFVNLYSADVLIDDNAIYRNTADNFGGGICVVQAPGVTISRNLIGGIFASDGNRVIKDRLPFPDSVLLNNPQGGAGGIGVYDCSVDILKNKIYYNQSNSGGGIEFYVNGGGEVIGNEINNNSTRSEVEGGGFPIGGDGGGMAVNPTSVTLASADRHRRVLVRANEIRRNHAEDDGGGIYATLKSIIDIEDCQIMNNTSRHNGGGIRCSFGTLVNIKNCEVAFNQCNLEQDPDPDVRKSGGGGIALRDSVAQLEQCHVNANEAVGFAGGGVYFVTLKEGGISFPGVPSFDELLTGMCRFTRGEFLLKDCDITGNTASGPLGAGGGLYVPYDQYDIHLKINQTLLSPNTAQHTDPAKAKNVVLQDKSNSDPIQNDETLPPLTPLQEFETVLEP
jgi:predicted outer membrane repeat protein